VPHVTLEYVIMIPVLILQIFLFPVVAGVLMNGWVVSRRTLALQEAGSDIGSTIQQMYFAVNQATVPAGTTSDQFGLPPFIDGYYYTANATLQSSGGNSNSGQVLTINLTLVSTAIKATSQVILGANAQWNATTKFVSNSANTTAYAVKLQNGASTTINLGFGG
jgi:hypothetical protein